MTRLRLLMSLSPFWWRSLRAQWLPQPFLTRREESEVAAGEVRGLMEGAMALRSEAEIHLVEIRAYISSFFD